MDDHHFNYSTKLKKKNPGPNEVILDFKLGHCPTALQV
jgi:hypothetical protein